MAAKKTIGIFDSGYGGLSVLSEAVRVLTDVDFLYYADTDHVPYGLRGNDEILSFTEDAVRFLTAKGADAVILACNTASAVAAAPLRLKYEVPIIAMEPAVRPALKEGNSARILVMATPVTLREEKLKNLIAREHGEARIDLLPMPGLVTLAEREIFDGPEPEAYLREKLSGYDLARYSAIVLGCTHFNYFKPLLRTFLDTRAHASVHLIEGSRGTVRRAASLLDLEPDPAAAGAASCVRYFVSGRPVEDSEEALHIDRLMSQMRCSMAVH